MNCFELSHVTFAPEKNAILHDINLTIPWGADLTIAGHSGSGKSTLLRLLATLLTPTSGTIRYNGKPQDDYDPISYRREVSYCAQQPALFHGTVADDLQFPFTIRHQKMPREEAERALESVDLAKTMLDDPVKNLSGGERQRAAIARALVNEPKCLLADEPTGNLDRKNAQNVLDMMLDLKRELNTSLIVVTHDDELAERFDRVMTMKDGSLQVLQ